jgi:hypothetical protein
MKDMTYHWLAKIVMSILHLKNQKSIINNIIIKIKKNSKRKTKNIMKKIKKN